MSYSFGPCDATAAPQLPLHNRKLILERPDAPSSEGAPCDQVHPDSVRCRRAPPAVRCWLPRAQAVADIPHAELEELVLDVSYRPYAVCVYPRWTLTPTESTKSSARFAAGAGRRC